MHKCRKQPSYFKLNFVFRSLSPSLALLSNRITQNEQNARQTFAVYKNERCSEKPKKYQPNGKSERHKENQLLWQYFLFD